MFTDHETQMIINTLSNLYDWETDNLENDFCQFICREVGSINYELAKKIFYDYNQLSPLVRDSIHFDYKDFLESSINHYIS